MRNHAHQRRGPTRTDPTNVATRAFYFRTAIIATDARTAPPPPHPRTLCGSLIPPAASLYDLSSPTQKPLTNSTKDICFFVLCGLGATQVAVFLDCYALLAPTSDVAHPTAYRPLKMIWSTGTSTCQTIRHTSSESRFCACLPACAPAPTASHSLPLHRRPNKHVGRQQSRQPYPGPGAGTVRSAPCPWLHAHTGETVATKCQVLRDALVCRAIRASLCARPPHLRALP